MKKAIGIDLGTTNSAVAVLEAGQPVIIPSAHGDRITPSVVSVNAAGQHLVGTPAKRSAVIDGENTVLAIKRFMGRKFHEQQGVREPAPRVGSTVSGVKRFMGVKVHEPSVEQDRQFVPYRVDEAESGDVRVWLGDRSYSPPEISAMILRQLKEDAEAYLGEEITQAVITVPAYFNDSQRKATMDAGALVGLEVLRILSEPTAAALAYGLNSGRGQTIAVYDLGGGTFDISILELCDGTFEVKAVNGDTHLGGDDIDRRIIQWLHRRLQKREGIDLRQDRIARQRLKDAAERAKVELTTAPSTEITLPFIAMAAAGPVHLRAVLTRSELEALASDIVERTSQCCRQALEDAGITPATLDQVVLVGGQTRMPLVQERVRQLFGEEPYKGLNPEEVVALGAAIQAGVLTGEIKDVLLLDVTPLTLSIETQGGIATPLIRRNTTIPASASQLFTTAEDNQPNVEINVAQGERAMAVENKSLGRFCLEGLAPALRGVPQVEVTFSIDADGILQVKARDRATGHQQQITVTADGALSEQEIERLKTEAKQFSQLDSQRRQEIRARNEADTCIHLAEETLRQHRGGLSAELVEVGERQIASLRAALQGANVLRIATAKRELQATLAEIMDQTAGPPPEVERIPRGLTRASQVPRPRDAPDELAKSA